MRLETKIRNFNREDAALDRIRDRENLDAHGKIIATICYVFADNNVLLLQRANKHPMPDCYIGVGGKVEKNETPFEGVVREVMEETGLKINPKYHGFGTYLRNGEPNWEVHYFSACVDRKNTSLCSEGILHWVDKNRAFDIIPAHDRSMYKGILEGRQIYLKFQQLDSHFVEQ